METKLGQMMLSFNLLVESGVVTLVLSIGLYTWAFWPGRIYALVAPVYVRRLHNNDN